MGVNFFSAKLDTKGGGGGGPSASCLMPQNLRVFIFEYFPYGYNLKSDEFDWRNIQFTFALQKYILSTKWFIE